MEVIVCPYTKDRNLRHRMQPLQTSTTKKIQDKCLSIVIGVVSDDNCPIAKLATQSCKPTVTKLSGSHLNAYTAICSISLCVKINPMEPDAIRVSPVPDEYLIPIALLTTKMKIAMSHSKGLRTELRQKEICHAHRIHSSAHSQKKTRRG
jgi:hypothetical protein